MTRKEWILSCFVVFLFLGIIVGILIYGNVQYEKEMAKYDKAVAYIISGQPELAREEIKTITAGHMPADLGTIEKVLAGYYLFKAGDIKDAYENVTTGTFKHVLISLDKVTDEELKNALNELLLEIKAEYEVFDAKEKEEAAARRKEKEQEALRELKTMVPYVGMSENMINNTSLGRYYAIRHNTETISGQVYTANLYDFAQNGRIVFTARCVRGKVIQVFDGRDKGGVAPKYLYNTPKSTYSKQEEDAEAFYEDHKDEFDSLEDAEEYLEDNE